MPGKKRKSPQNLKDTKSSLDTQECETLLYYLQDTSNKSRKLKVSEPLAEYQLTEIKGKLKKKKKP